MSNVQAYVKLEDYEAIKTEMEKLVGDTPVIYVVGDVCREELLVEVEGIATAKYFLKQ